MRIIKIIAITILILIYVPLFAQNSTMSTGSMVIEKEGMNTLLIKTPQNLRCNIKITTYSENSIKVDYQIWAKAKSSAQEKRFIDLIEVKLDDKTDQVNKPRLRVLTPAKAPWEGTDNSAGVNLDIIIPEDFKVYSHNSYSSVVMFGPFSDVEVFNDYGQIKIDNVAGDLVVKASYSPVELSDIEGSVSIETRYANIAGKNIVISDSPGIFTTSHGSVTLDRINGPIEVNTSQNFIKVSDVDAGNGCIILSTSYGLIEAANLSGELVCETSYKSVELENIRLTHGMNKIETKYAPVNISLDYIDDAQLLISNTFSSIDVMFASDISAKLMLAVDKGGKIHTQGFPIKPLAVDKNRLVGIVGNGLSKIEINIDGIGEINIKGR